MLSGSFKTNRNFRAHALDPPEKGEVKKMSMKPDW
jgi:hypothetical protein